MNNIDIMQNRLNDINENWNNKRNYANILNQLNKLIFINHIIIVLNLCEKKVSYNHGKWYFQNS